ncbi:MAG TPA: ABC transporter substrate-binding protein [Mycobacteriales bacterium]|nr:ABC transporter substrate-binding protein [Mycobacteriales bacterium]
MKRPVAAAALVLILSGCGSTVEMGTGPASVGSASGGQGLGGPGGGLSVPTTTSYPTGSASVGTNAGGTGGIAAPSGSSVAAGGGNAATPGTPHKPAKGSGTPTAASSADHTPIRIGLLYGKDVGAAAAAVGLGGLSTGDTLAQSKAMVHWVNSHGGMGGHPIELSSYGISATGGGDADSAYQAACTSLTQDQHVRYVVTILSLRPASLPCFAKAGVGVLDDESGVSETQMAEYSNYIAGPGDYSMSRSTADLVDDLVRRGWLTSNTKIGVLTYDTPADHAVVSGTLVRALRQHGLHITAAAAVPNTTAYWTQVGGVVLKFRTAGVDRIISVDASPLSLMISASSQGYRPAYSVVSNFGPGALLEGTAPKDQLVNSVGIGWQPFLDIGKGKHPGPVSSNQTLCFKLMQQAGQASTSATTQGFEAQICDLFFYLKKMGDTLPTLPANMIAASRPLIGDSFKSAATFRSDMRQHPDGVAAYRDLAYEQSCSCYQYVSPIRRTTS